MLAVRNCCYVAVCSAARGASVPTGGGEGREHIMDHGGRPPSAYLRYINSAVRRIVFGARRTWVQITPMVEAKRLCLSMGRIVHGAKS